MELNRIYNIDCLKGLKSLNDNIVDLVVTSPPYDDLRNYDGYTWDFENIVKELFRVLKDGGVVVWVVNDKTVKGTETGSSFKQALYFKEIGFNLHDTMIYAKNNPTPTKSNRYQASFEFMFIFSKGKPKTFNPILEDKKYKESRIEKWYNKDVNGNQTKAKVSQSTKKIKSNIWYYSVGKNHTTKDSIAFKHPAIFPEKLAEDHILTWSNPDDLVVDIFSGVATTCKMALLNNRRYLGFEISSNFCELGNERLKIYKS